MVQGQKHVHYEKAILAVGSRPAMPSAFHLGDRRVMTSTQALELEEIPETLLVVGGGYIGMELGTVYAALGSAVVVVEALDSILTGADSDLTRPVKRRAETLFREIRTSTRITSMTAAEKGIQVSMESGDTTLEERYDRVLVAVGRTPNTHDLGLENTLVTCDDKGFVRVNQRQETTDPAIYAIGDVTGGVLLAHKASKEGRVAIEAIEGESSTLKDSVIPAVVFTDPEIAWCGLTESEAKAKKIAVTTARFPWSASGRAVSMDRTEGLTKLILEPETARVLGVGIVGSHAGDLISEGALAVEMGATAKDLAHVAHPHPTLSETLMEAAEVFYGLATHRITKRR
jgi:dihydrolipoamide dehydrogenase